MRLLLALLFSLPMLCSNAQKLPVPSSVGDKHPRIYGKDMSKQDCQKLIEDKQWATDILKKTKNHLSPIMKHVEKQDDWLVSRLQMYWESKSNQVYIDGGNYSHAEGEAPVPTVKFIGQRGWSNSNYDRPKLEDVKPYMDDERGLYLQNSKTKQWEWGAIANTGGIVSSINKEVFKYAKEAAFLYWIEGDEKYAKLAYGVLDTYLQGLYYLNEPIDLSHGHHQTLVGYTEFEVIQEHIIGDVAACYDFLHDYIKADNPDKIDFYGATFQKWADQQIKNGVSFNNWNLFQAAHISKIALVLEDNSYYENGKGGAYYLDQIMNHTSTRQWSMSKLINYGYDETTGIWNESPGYSVNVLNDFIHFVEFYDQNFGIDLIEELPIFNLAAKNTVQYMMPNNFMVSFGDGHYKNLPSDAIQYMVQNAQKFDRPEDEKYFTKLLKTLNPDKEYNGEFIGKNIQDLFIDGSLKIDDNIEAAENISEFLYPTFYVPKASWLVQRSGDNENDALMYSMIGSKGNHMHSNGIAMELYGKGLPLAPELGHGTSYFHIDYAEFYTQFPAHNTVIVNGKSKYPEMKSNHAFRVNALYPASQEMDAESSSLFSDVSFLEPETNSNQRRVLGIINHKQGGYYIDIFHSKKNEGGDVKHEYFYHNLGQSLNLYNTSGNELTLEPTSKLAFGDGDLFAYDYMWDKKSIETDEDFKGRFNLKLDDRTVNMNLWARGDSDREVFSVMSPKSTANPYVNLPKEMNDNPTPTLVVRQNGEAWNRPFVMIYEPAENNESSISKVSYFGEGEQVGICVEGKSGSQDYIFSTTDEKSEFTHDDMTFVGTYATISKEGNSDKLMLGNGTRLSNSNYTINSDAEASIYVEVEVESFTIDSDNAFELRVKSKSKKAKLVGEDSKEYVASYDKNTKELVFEFDGELNNEKMELK